MSKIFAPLLLLPLIELIGLIVIGGEIGLLATLVWLAGATWLGFYLMRLRGRSAFARAQRVDQDEVFVVQDLFDGFCLFIASVLLIFPGFISDFTAVPLIMTPMRHWIFNRIKKDPNHPARKFARAATAPPAGESAPKPADIIDGDYRRMDE